MTHVDQDDARMFHRRRRARDEHPRPLALLVALIREQPKASDAELQASFIASLDDEENETYRQRLYQEWLDLKFNDAKRVAHPPTVAELKAQREAMAAQRKERARQQAEFEKQLHERILKIGLLNLVMPNGKLFKDCTGTECTGFGGWFVEIGSKIGKRGVVGKKLTEDQLRHMWMKEQGKTKKDQRQKDERP